MRAIPRFVSSLCLLAAVAGCHDPLTQVVIVFQSDLDTPNDADGIQMIAAEGALAPGGSGPVFGSAGPLPGTFPLSVGVTSAGATASFSFTVELLAGFNNNQPPSIVVNRTVTDIRFVDEQTMMLVLPLLRVCACQGTSCPNPGNPLCDNVDKPTLQPFDPAIAPPSTMLGLSNAVQPTPLPGRPAAGPEDGMRP